MSLTADQILNTKLTSDQIALWYLGQEGYLVRCHDTYLLFDPYLTDSVDRIDPAFRRRFAPPILPQELDFIDYIFCSHDHLDHTDPETLSILAQHNPQATFFVSQTFAHRMPNYGVPAHQVQGLVQDTTISLAESIQLTAIPAAHDTREQDENGVDAHLGFLVQLPQATLYHAGDCCLYDGLSERLPPLDIALLPINGRDYFRTRDNIIGNMDSREAILLAQTVGVNLLIPMHHDLYPNNGLNPAHFVDWLQQLAPDQATHLFTPGERYLYAR